MSTLSTEEAIWIENQVRHNTAGSAWDLLTEQTRMTLAEIGAHTRARMCNSMQELSGTKNAIKLGSTGNHLSDTTLRRQLAKNTGTRETTTRVVQPEMWIILYTSTDSAQQIDDLTKTDRT